MIPPEIKNRKGARSLKDLNPAVLPYLNEAKVETKNLIEWLATDQLVLLRHVLQELGKPEWFSDFESAVLAQKKRTANTDVKVIGQSFGLESKSSALYDHLRNHTSDVVRCWACWAESLHHDDLPDLLATMKPYAADLHFGVREVVIFATKERLIAALDMALKALSVWVLDKDEHVRRYAVEVMRPIGVWTKKIEVFQQSPEKGRQLLEPLKSDESKYVRDAVANWLNDASKSNPDWVRDLCLGWEKTSNTKETTYIIKRALRTINK